jgi:hypothetical protein
MFHNSLDTVVSSVCHDKSLIIVHRLTGGYVTREADAQIRSVPLADRTDKRHLWTLVGDGHRNGNLMYRIKSVFDGTVMAVNSDNPKDGIKFPKPAPSGQVSTEAEAQRWFILPRCAGGYSIVPVVFPGYVLGPIDKNPAINLCDRLNEVIGGVESDVSGHDFASEEGRKDPRGEVPPPSERDN